MLVCAIICSNLLEYLGETDTKSEIFGLDTQLQCNSNTPYKQPAPYVSKGKCAYNDLQ